MLHFLTADHFDGQEDKEIAALLDVLKFDPLRQQELNQQQQAERYISLAAKLIAPGLFCEILVPFAPLQPHSILDSRSA
jgi:hypothetical protein